MRILIFEWLLGGGQWIVQNPPDFHSPMMQQGGGMLRAVVRDFGCFVERIFVPVDSRVDREHEWLWAATSNKDESSGTDNLGGSDAVIEAVYVDSQESLASTLKSLAHQVDHVLLIAPESDGLLSQCCQWLEGSSDKFVSPDLQFVTLTSDKQATTDWLQQRGVTVPRGSRLSDIDSEFSLELSVVLKPIDGAGSEQVQIVKDWATFVTPDDPENWRVEEFIQGESVSVSAICDGDKFELLPPTGQIFEESEDNVLIGHGLIGHYVNAKYPLEDSVSARASNLAAKAIKALPPTRGYIGIDMVISDIGAEFDCVIEVNPRLTMSYLRLREICDGNLAEKMVARQKF